MISILTLEVNYVIIPAVIIFTLFVVPIPFLTRFICRAMSIVEKPNFYGISILLLITVATLISFVLQFLEWRKRFSQGKPRFADLSMGVDWEARKWRHERNMYIHALATVLCAAVMKFTRLQTALQKVNDMKKSK